LFAHAHDVTTLVSEEGWEKKNMQNPFIFCPAGYILAGPQFSNVWIKFD